MSRRLVSASLVPAALALAAGVAAAQVPDLPAGPPTQFRGQMGAFLELYEISGRPAQRPSATARLYFESAVTLLGAVTMEVDALASTEDGARIGSAATGRQPLNQIGLRPEWAWGRAYLGSFSDAYSPLTWNGTQVQGAGFAVEPGLLRLAAFGGNARRAVSGGATTGAFDRTMFGGRIGVGNAPDEGDGGSHLDVVFLRAADDVSSLAAPVETDDDPPQDLFADTFPAQRENEFAVTPQENVVLGTVGSLGLLDDALLLRGELTGAIHTRDRRASSLDQGTIGRFPSVLSDVITPRVSTTADYAYTAEARLRIDELPGATRQSPRSLDLTAKHRYVGPGYVSLGAPSVLTDQRAVEMRARVRFRSWSVGLNGLRQSDNLVDQKLATTTRNRLASTFSVRPSGRWTASFRGTLLTMANDAEDPTRTVDYTNWVAETRQSVRLGREGLVRSAGVRYGFRTSGDEGARGASADLLAHTIGVQAVLHPLERVSVRPSIGLVETRAGEEGWSTRATYGLSGRYSPGAGRWSLSASLSSAALEGATSTRATASSRFRIGEKSTVNLRLRSNLIRNDDAQTPDSEEFAMSLDFRRRL